MNFISAGLLGKPFLNKKSGILEEKSPLTVTVP